MTSERINWCVLVNKNTNKTYLRKKAMKRDLSNPIDEYQERVKRERETYLFFRADNNEYVFEKTIAPLGRA